METRSNFSKKSKSIPSNILSFLSEMLDHHKCEEIRQYFNIKGDYTTSNAIICTAMSERHCKAVGEHLIKELKSQKIQLISSLSSSPTDWVVIDCGTVMIHIMTDFQRQRLQIDSHISNIGS